MVVKNEEQKENYWRITLAKAAITEEDRYKSLKMHGTISPGLQLWKEFGENWIGPFIIQTVYVQRGSGVQSVLETEIDDFHRATRIGGMEDGVNKVYSLTDLDIGDFYIKIGAEYGEAAME